MEKETYSRWLHIEFCSQILVSVFAVGLVFVFLLPLLGPSGVFALPLLFRFLLSILLLVDSEVSSQDTG